MSLVEEKHEWSAARVRQTFLDYFKERGHTFVPSSSVVPLSDPTLLFTNAGMNQYKSIFQGTVDPSSDFAQLKRAANSQKCIRAGGKHNDLDDVGKDSYHHTFFEMLGNWSFGDYFKKEAIGFTWELLTGVYGIDPQRLYVTYFEGADGLEPDLEAKELWKSVGVPEDHILPGDMKDNFWEMGDQGPCGPCSEVHYDLREPEGGKYRNAASLVNMDDPEVIEIWNNVFMQYNREPDRSLRPLPNKHIDTGMGYERLVSVLQHKKSNYDTDVFTPLFKKIQEITGAREYRGKFGAEDPDGIDTAYRVVADHVRMMSFAIADGGVPNNVGRGYVVRRVLRRGARYARKYFETDIGDFFSKIVPTLVEQMGDMFPEIKKKQQDIVEILDEEEKAFAKSLDRGEVIFEKYAQKAKVKGSDALPGDDVWRLYDTYGFPVDLTKLMAEERGLKIDDKEVEEAQEKAREASKGDKKAAGALVKFDVHDLGALENMPDVPKTDDSAKYGRENITSVIKAIYHNKKFLKSTKEVPEGEQFGVLLDRTNFYAEQGGQEYDMGKLVVDGEACIDITNVQVYAGYVLHTGYLQDGELSVGSEVIAEFDESRRHPIRNNHTGTHVLNYALREVLGNEVDQKGSLVAPEKLRFDFSHKAGLSEAELDKVESISSKYIKEDAKVYAKDVPLASAKEIRGVRAVFGETYPDPVRVVSVGVPVEELLADVKNEKWEKLSIEFCGGTHVLKTGEIKELVILEESGIAKGIRRIVAVTGQEAYRVQRLATQFQERVEAMGKMPFGPQKEAEAKKIGVDLNNLTISALAKAKLRDQFAKIQKSMLDEQKAAAKADNKRVMDEVNKFFEDETKKFMVKKLDWSSNVNKAISEAIKTISGPKSALKDRSLYLFSASPEEGKVVHGCYVSEPFKNAGADGPKWASAVTPIIGGKAGGKPGAPTAIGQGTNADKVDEGVEEARKWIEGLKI
ncbi:AlaS Alanyl-tRNA synthetase [Pyrenophora tritici-repentis]|uniref:Alanine--tRNA ligase n=2 Tax=Pyrenophora tritici-repentis TaxID=45151 RepID=A0A2W1G399_9PLEO|nr:alanyl-tRNA synthetase [Pyrenophora tritici-repentis Pt-1C-BFP]KAA8617039.1 alanyl-trna synthetase protein [Pyrenophora tritici-repentis]EDU50574.1 alanyl-tRNA synthetase [Pyrenophora tritici-repentis Pt-1C-BFP]KAF7446327.1 alanyl-trna synthetase protein [Pyrenophora tritici-repentis]KAF7567436.1 AlaS, Alanyl-tRNA synthetase [Pyrenophora tritici-repentis]KAI0583479.1 alanyl-trna synthetase protein [Pyrenophora tritici-repentis]